MRGKLVGIEEAIDLCTPGCSIALGGATMRRKPMALVRELASRPLERLDLWTWIGSLDVDLLIAAGRVRSVNSAYVGFGAFGLAQASRRAFADGSVAFHDWSESSLLASFRAGASGMPVALTRALLGTSLAEELGELVRLPFADGPLIAIPAARPDVALIHAQSADELGNVRRRRPNLTDDVDHLIAACARTVIVSVEEVEDAERIIANRDETVIPGHYVTALVHAPRGAHPTGCDGCYQPDLAHLAEYARASASAEGVRDYLAGYVEHIGAEDYRAIFESATTR
ncbi:MAG: CoA transferase subunit A [Solirubrobacteraceae bacterium]